jgi:hypothetical protein
VPGFLCLRKLSWNPIEKLCASVGLSLLLVYLAAWCIYCLSPGGEAGQVAQTRGFIAVSVTCFALAALAVRNIVELVRSARVRRALLGYSFLFVWTLLILAVIRHYSGLGWGIDWLEHFQRALFFLHRFAVDTPIVMDAVPARPPMMNVLAAFFLAQTSDSYALFQILFVFLNLLLFLPCCLMLPLLSGGRKARILPLVLIFAASPIVIENATYSWTKSLSAFYVLLALWFYLAAIRKNDSVRMVAAFVAAASGLLVHYSAGPYCVFLALHYLIRVFWKRPRKWRELATVAICGGLVLATWFSWSIAVFGLHKTFLSNTSVTSAQKYPGSNFAKIAANMFDSVVPWPLRDWSMIRQFDQPNLLGAIRDGAFGVYQTNLVFSMGLVGGPLVLWFLFRKLRNPSAAGTESPCFWRALIAAGVLIGLAVVGERDRFGTAHLTLIPLEVLGLILLAAEFSRRRNIAFLLLAGCIVDFSLGVLLQARMEALENTPSRTVFTIGVSPIDGSFQTGPPTPETLSSVAQSNWFAKHKYAFSGQLQQAVMKTPPLDEASRQLVSRMQAQLQKYLNEDDLYFHVGPA